MRLALANCLYVSLWRTWFLGKMAPLSHLVLESRRPALLYTLMDTACHFPSSLLQYTPSTMMATPSNCDVLNGGADSADDFVVTPKLVKVEAETRPDFKELQSIERKRREILLRVSLLLFRCINYGCCAFTFTNTCI